MKKILKANIVVLVSAMLLAVWGLFPVLGNAATLQDIEKVWGKPVSVVKMDNGGEKRYYIYENNGVMDGKYRLFIIQDGKVIDGGLAVTIYEPDNCCSRYSVR